MILSLNESRSVLEALRVAIREVERHQREVLKYTSDSAQLAAWKSIAAALRREVGEE